MPILSMRLSDAKRGGSSATPMGYRACSPRVPLATPRDGDHQASCGSAVEARFYDVIRGINQQVGTLASELLDEAAKWRDARAEAGAKHHAATR